MNVKCICVMTGGHVSMHCLKLSIENES